MVATGVAGSCFDSCGDVAGLVLSSSVSESDGLSSWPAPVILVTRHGGNVDEGELSQGRQVRGGCVAEAEGAVAVVLRVALAVEVVVGSLMII